MPYICLELPEYLRTISQPVARRVARDIADVIGIPQDQKIYLPTELETIARPGPSLMSNTETDFGGEGTKGVIAVLEEEVWEYAELTTSMFLEEQMPFFEDKELDMMVRPIYTKTEATLRFTAFFESKTAAHRWKERIRHRVTAGQREFMHKAAYAYLIPKYVMKLLMHVHSLREQTAGYGEDWKTYCEKHFVRRLSTLTAQNVKFLEPAIKEEQSQIMGWWDFEQQPEVADQSEAGERWRIEFTYQYRYDRPSAVGFRYPLLVHNQLIDDAYIPFEMTYSPKGEEVGYKSLTRFMLDGFVKQVNPQPMVSGYRIPEWNEWFPRKQLPDTSTLFTAMIQLSPDNLTKICNLSDLGEYELDPGLLNYIGENHTMITVYGSAVFHLQLYQGKDMLPDGTITLERNFDVVAVEPLDIRKTYHLRLSMLTDLRKLRPYPLKQLLKDADTVYAVLLTLDPSLAEKGGLPIIIGGSISERSFKYALSEVEGSIRKAHKGFEALLPTVNFITVAGE